MDEELDASGTEDVEFLVVLVLREYDLLRAVDVLAHAEGERVDDLRAEVVLEVLRLVEDTSVVVDEELPLGLRLHSVHDLEGLVRGLLLLESEEVELVEDLGLEVLADPPLLHVLEHDVLLFFEGGGFLLDLGEDLTDGVDDESEVRGGEDGHDYYVEFFGGVDRGYVAVAYGDHGDKREVERVDVDLAVLGDYVEAEVRDPVVVRVGV